jgi:hypothetical protein
VTIDFFQENKSCGVVLLALILCQYAKKLTVRRESEDVVGDVHQ